MKKLYDYTEDMIYYKESLGYARRTYEGFLNDFARFVKRNYPDAEYLTEDIALEWCQQRESENSSGYHRRAAAFRELTKYLYAVGSGVYILPADYTARPERYTPYIFTDQELVDFFHASDQVLPCKSSPSRSFIIPVIYRLIYFCGLRPNEGRELQKQDVNLEDGILFIRKNKSHRERMIPMAHDITEMCREYSEKASWLYPENPCFFPSPTGNAYSAKWLSQNFRKLWDTVKSDKNTCPVRVYDLRHRYATAIMMKWVNEGVDLCKMIPYLSTYMGHANFSATAYYIHLLPENLVRSSAIDWQRFIDLVPEVDYDA